MPASDLPVAPSMSHSKESPADETCRWATQPLRTFTNLPVNASRTGGASAPARGAKEGSVVTAEPQRNRTAKAPNMVKAKELSEETASSSSKGRACSLSAWQTWTLRRAVCLGSWLGPDVPKTGGRTLSSPHGSDSPVPGPLYSGGRGRAMSSQGERFGGVKTGRCLRAT